MRAGLPLSGTDAGALPEGPGNARHSPPMTITQDASA